MAPRRLSVLCITKAEPHAWRFLDDLWQTVKELPFPAELVIALDHTHGETDLQVLNNLTAIQWPYGANNLRILSTASKGYLESIYNEAVNFCDGEYVLRLDDDERMNQPMIDWLTIGGFMQQDHWKFDRAHLWQDEYQYITAQPLWPDHQTRLSIKAKAGGRKTIHAGSPHGGGILAPGCVIEHHVFLVRTLEERQAKLARYNQIHPGAGWPIFHTPEIFTLATKPYSSARHPDDQG